MVTAITIWICVVYFVLSVDSFKCKSSPFRARKWLGVRIQKSRFAVVQERIHSRRIQAANENDTLNDNTYSVRQQVDKLISTQLMNSSLSVKQMQWGKDGLDITLINTINGVKVSPTSDELDSFHKSMYKLSENDANLSAALESLDITVSSPGIGDVLQTDRDFETFKVLCTNLS